MIKICVAEGKGVESCGLEGIQVTPRNSCSL